MVIGIGIDLVEVRRIKALLQTKPNGLKRLFTSAEIRYCRAKKKNSSESFAARFAAKEAFLKAIGTGWGAKSSPKWQEIEVINAAHQYSTLRLSGKARLICQKLKVKKIHLSLTHTKQYALAVVILEGK